MKRYQDIAHTLHRHIVELTKAGEFEGHQAARTVLIWFAMNIANKDDSSNGLQRGFVMQGCVSQPAVCQATGLSQAAVSKSMSWLAENGFIRARHQYEGKRQRIASVEITSHDMQSEAERKAWLNRAPERVPAPRAKQQTKLRLVVN